MHGIAGRTCFAAKMRSAAPEQSDSCCRSAPVARRQDYDYLIKLLLIGDSGA
jgi:hypothetical protein